MCDLSLAAIAQWECQNIEHWKKSQADNDSALSAHLKLGAEIINKQADEIQRLTEWLEWIEEDSYGLQASTDAASAIAGCKPPKFENLKPPVSVQHKPIQTAPENTRILVFGEMPDGLPEMAMAWKDRMDKQWYHAPQGGLIPFVPKHWCPVPEPESESS